MDFAEESSFGSLGRMGASSDTPNPLRPYYKPPSIGFPDISPNSPPFGPRRSTPGNDIKELFNDLDYGDYFPGNSPSIGDMAKSIMDKAVWNYTSTVLAQPFEVAKVILQTYDAGAVISPATLSEAKRSYSKEADVCISVHLTLSPNLT
jgi:fusion and transport protein UGO1